MAGLEAKVTQHGVAAMWADQAIFTSLERGGLSGYHIVSRSPGVTEPEAAALATWAPSHGGLIVDAENRTSVNFHPLPTGRFVISRTCEGRPEYSGRGTRQLYTHALIVGIDTLRHSDFQPIVIYRDALALGHLHYRPDPGGTLKPVVLCSYCPRRPYRRFAAAAREMRLPPIEVLLENLNAGQPMKIPFRGDRILAAECLLGQLDPDSIFKASFSTSLYYSSVRPYWLSLVGDG